jgi:2-polyprenyl-6-methoxyphenol hydroxylase-like FAD-dependent oxidoreductase
MAESADAVFKQLVEAVPPRQAPVLFKTACVLGGSIAGLAAARVLADHAHEVVIIERDVVSVEGCSRASVPQDQHVHALLPGGFNWLDRWLPGLGQDMLGHGAQLSGEDRVVQYQDGQLQASRGARRGVSASRPLIESRIRASVLALPNVRLVRSQATGMEYRDGRVSAVLYGAREDTAVLPVDFVVDATGRASKLSGWLSREGYENPRLLRVTARINYASARFKRARWDGRVVTGARFGPPYPADGVAGAAAVAIEDGQWLVTLMSYEGMRPGRTLEAMRQTCAKLPPAFTEAASGPVKGQVVTYSQSDSRRRDFTHLTRFPAGLVSIGDAVATFNPIYGQGMSSAVLQASCLSRYLRADPDLGGPAAGFFDLQKIVVDAAWAVSAGADMARLDALTGADIPEDVARQRLAFGQVVIASTTDEAVYQAVNDVFAMLAHPQTLADPGLLERVTAATAK